MLSRSCLAAGTAWPGEKAAARKRLLPRARRENPMYPAKPASQALARDEIKGRLVLHHDGYGFVVPAIPVPQLDGDLFIPPSGIEGAMHGDQVVARIKPAYGVTGTRRAEGTIVRILGRAHASVVGLFRYGSRGNTVQPYDVRIQNEIEIPAGDELTPALREKLGLPGLNEPGARLKRLPELPELAGAVVNVELTRYSRGGAPPVGRVVEILGRPGDLGVDIEIIIRKHHLPHVFSPAVLARSRKARRAGQRNGARRPRRFSRVAHRDYRWRNCARLRRRGVRGAPRRRRLAFAGAHRGCLALRAHRQPARSGSAAARNLRLFSRPRRAHAS